MYGLIHIERPLSGKGEGGRGLRQMVLHYD